jgi:hypothetical protein
LIGRHKEEDYYLPEVDYYLRGKIEKLKMIDSGEWMKPLIQKLPSIYLWVNSNPVP